MLGLNDPILLGLLTDATPLSERLDTAARQLQGMHTGGELAALSQDTRTVLAGLALFLVGAADEAREFAV